MEVLLRKQSEADLFNDIEINDKYSSIAKKLPIIVGSNCFEDFKKKINTPIKVKVRNSISLLCENLKEIKNNNYKPFDPQKYLKYLEEETIELYLKIYLPDTPGACPFVSISTFLCISALITLETARSTVTLVFMEKL